MHRPGSSHEEFRHWQEVPSKMCAEEGIRIRPDESKRGFKDKSVLTCLEQHICRPRCWGHPQ